MNKQALIAIAVLIALAGAVWFYTSLPDGESAISEDGLGSELLKKAQEPVRESLPETNPLKEVETNPFKGYKNPFGE